MYRDGIYNMAGMAARIGTNVLSIPLLISILGLDNYGRWTFVFAVLGITGLAESGMSATTAVFLSRELGKGTSGKIHWVINFSVIFILVMASITAIATFFLGGHAASALLGLGLESAEVLQSIKIISLSVWAGLVQQILMGIHQAQQRYKVIFALTTLQAVATNTGLVVVAYLGGRVAELASYHSAVSLAFLAVHIVVSYVSVSKLGSWQFSASFAGTGKMLAFSSKCWLVSVGSALFGRFDRVLVGAMLGPSSLAVYGAITGLTTQINTLSAMPVQPLLPHLTRLLANRNTTWEHISESVRRAALMNSAIAFSSGAAAIFGAPIIVKFLLEDGTQFPAIQALQIAAAIYAAYSLNAVGYFVLIAADAVGELAVVNLLSGLLALTLIAWLTREMGLLGAIIGNSGYLLSLLFLILAYRVLQKTRELNLVLA